MTWHGCSSLARVAALLSPEGLPSANRAGPSLVCRLPACPSPPPPPALLLPLGHARRNLSQARSSLGNGARASCRTPNPVHTQCLHRRVWTVTPTCSNPQGELCLFKPGKGSFGGTDLDAYLHDKGVTSLIFAGVTTDVSA